MSSIEEPDLVGQDPGPEQEQVFSVIDVDSESLMEARPFAANPRTPRVRASFIDPEHGER